MDAEQLSCTSCGATIPPGAERCASCGELAKNFKQCPECYERVKLQAARCRFCKFEFPLSEPAQTANLNSVLTGFDSGDTTSPADFGDIDFTICATSLGGLFCNHSLTAVVRPPEMRVTDREINLKSWSVFGLRSIEQKIPTSRITSVRLVLGVQWGAIVVETFGGGMADYEICGLKKREARDMADVLEKYVLRNSPVYRTAVSETTALGA
jgi:hypothetical protein